MKFYDKMGVKGCMGKGEKFMKTLGGNTGIYGGESELFKDRKGLGEGAESTVYP